MNKLGRIGLITIVLIGVPVLAILLFSNYDWTRIFAITAGLEMIILGILIYRFPQKFRQTEKNKLYALVVLTLIGLLSLYSGLS